MKYVFGYVFFWLHFSTHHTIYRLFRDLFRGATNVASLNLKTHSFHVSRSKPCPCRYFTIVFALVFIAVAVSIQPLCHLSPFHLSYVIVSRPCCLSKFTLTGPLLRDIQLCHQPHVTATGLLQPRHFYGHFILAWTIMLCHPVTCKRPFNLAALWPMATLHC